MWVLALSLTQGTLTYAGITASVPMAFAVSPKNIFSPENRYTKVSNQNGLYDQQVQDPRFASAAPW